MTTKHWRTAVTRLQCSAVPGNDVKN